jgi:hypothetical protein
MRRHSARHVSGRISGLLAAACLTVVTLDDAWPQASNPVAAPAWITAQLPGATQVGQGMLRFLGLAVYDAALFASPAESPGQEVLRRSFALSLRYNMRFSGASIAQTSIDEIKRLGRGTPEQHARWLARMSTIFPDVARNDQITGIHRPGLGALFFFNERFLGQIEDPAFSDAFFSIWLAPETREPSLRQALLAGLDLRTAPDTPRPSSGVSR